MSGVAQVVYPQWQCNSLCLMVSLPPPCLVIFKAFLSYVWHPKKKRSLSLLWTYPFYPFLYRRLYLGQWIVFIWCICSINKIHTIFIQATTVHDLHSHTDTCYIQILQDLDFLHWFGCINCQMHKNLLRRAGQVTRNSHLSSRSRLSLSGSESSLGMTKTRSES